MKLKTQQNPTSSQAHHYVKFNPIARPLYACTTARRVDRDINLISNLLSRDILWLLTWYCEQRTESVIRCVTRGENRLCTLPPMKRTRLAVSRHFSLDMPDNATVIPAILSVYNGRFARGKSRGWKLLCLLSNRATAGFQWSHTVDSGTS